MSEENKTVKWIDKKIEDKLISFDERFLIKLYRFCKAHYEFWVGFVVALVIVTFIIK